jgi:serine/threonine-protein kinase HipA
MFKYGANVQVLHGLSQACSDKLTTPVRLLRWLVFNLLIGNDDSHLKNLSFLVSPGRVDLAPHYDLLATGIYHTRAFANERGRWPAVPLAVRLSPEVERFDQVTPESVLDAAAILGVPSSLALRTVREVVTRVLVAIDGLYARHDPQQEGLMVQLKAKGLKVPEVAVIDEPTALGAELAQRRRILRVLRSIVLPEMTPRLLP